MSYPMVDFVITDMSLLWPVYKLLDCELVGGTSKL